MFHDDLLREIMLADVLAAIEGAGLIGKLFPVSDGFEPLSTASPSNAVAVSVGQPGLAATRRSSIDSKVSICRPDR